MWLKYRYAGLAKDVNAQLDAEHFHCPLDDRLHYARSGLMGLMRGKALYVVGSLETSLYFNELQYFPGDLEATVQNVHDAVYSCAVCGYRDLLMVVVEMRSELPGTLASQPQIT